MSLPDKTRADFVAALDLLDRCVAATPAQTWKNDSPCEGWSAADVLAHCVANLRALTASATGSDFSEVASRPVDGDPAEAWSVEAPRARSLVDAGELDTLTLGGREVPAVGLLDALMRDMVIHTWDINEATGGDTPVPDDLVEAATEAMGMVGPALRRPGFYGDELEAPEGADALTRLLGLSGRRAW
jgi:uncharacterized protein (TIGR03086 family)